MAWATEAEVLALTGTAVTAAHLTQAQGVIDLFSGATETTEDLNVRNLRLLKAAAAYQAAWMAAQVDVPGRVEVSRVDQDGVEVHPAHEDALVLAPLARRALAQLSWRRRATVTVRAGRVPRFATHEEWAAAWLADGVGGYWRAS